MVNKRPFFLPPLHRLGIIKGSWLFFKQRQIVERIKDILFASITASMARQLLLSVENLDGKGIGLHRHGSACLFDWDRIAVGFILSLRIRGESDGNSVTTVVVVIPPCVLSDDSKMGEIRHRADMLWIGLKLHQSITEDLNDLIEGFRIPICKVLFA